MANYLFNLNVDGCLVKVLLSTGNVRVFVTAGIEQLSPSLNGNVIATGNFLGRILRSLVNGESGRPTVDSLPPWTYFQLSPVGPTYTAMTILTHAMNHGLVCVEFDNLGSIMWSLDHGTSSLPSWYEVLPVIRRLTGSVRGRGGRFLWNIQNNVFNVAFLNRFRSAFLICAVPVRPVDADLEQEVVNREMLFDGISILASIGTGPIVLPYYPETVKVRYRNPDEDDEENPGGGKALVPPAA